MNPRKPQDVMDEVMRIQGISDPVAAHAAEDNLYYSIILTIANGQGEDYQNMCKQAIKSQNIKFDRGYQL